MSRVFRELLCIIILSIYVISASVNQTKQWEDGKDYCSNSPFPIISTDDYEARGPIAIASNEDFSLQGWPGNGTKLDPFLIEGLSIHSVGVGITISNTTAYFEIRNCLISAYWEKNPNAIVLKNVSHGTIHRTIVEMHRNGIYLENAVNCTLANNTASYNRFGGFFLSNSSSCTLINNTADSNSIGFYLFKSNKSLLINNAANNNEGDGIHISCSDSCLIANNTSNNNENGISVGNSKGVSLTYNAAANNSRNGFDIWNAFSFIITNNLAAANAVSAFFLYSCNSTSMRNNSLTNNGLVLYGREMIHYLHDISHNTINGKLLGYFMSQTDQAINGSEYGQIILANCSSVTVTEGVFINASIGVQVAFSTNCILNSNTAENNSMYGFHLDSSNSSLLTNNTARNNLFYGIYMNGMTWNNTAYSNYLGNNKRANACDDGDSNLWDDGASQGNYWCDYSGLGPYEIYGRAGSIDHYPLMLYPSIVTTETILALLVATSILALIFIIMHLRHKSLLGSRDSSSGVSDDGIPLW